MFGASITLGLLVWLSAAAAAPADAGTMLPHLSPTGKYDLSFEEIARSTFSREEQLQALDNMDHIEYAVSFRLRGTGALAAATRYVDVYGFNRPPDPTPVDRIRSWFIWSPEDDFVVLPSEGWASAPGTPERIVLSLSDQLDWSESRLVLQNLTWIDALHVVGDRHSDCDRSVDIFDGEAGTQRAVVESISPIGHRITSVQDRTMMIRRVLDNCANAEQRASFETRCLALNLDTMELKNAPCP